MALRATRPSGAATGRVPPSVAVSASCAGADAVLTDVVAEFSWLVALVIGVGLLVASVTSTWRDLSTLIHRL